MTKLNDAKYSMELADIDLWEIDDRIWMQKRMSFDVLDLQKHQKRLKYKGEYHEQFEQCPA